MTPAAAKTSSTDALDASEAGSHWLTGLLIISLFPALFWTGILALVAGAMDQPLDPMALATIATAIAAFLAAVVSALSEE